MAVTIRQDEATPAAFPPVPMLSPAAAALDAAAIWQRIEAYTAYRFTPREVVWIVEGDGDWCPPLAPLEITAEEVWQDGAWAPATVFASPYGGYRLTTCGPFRFTGTAGGGQPPAVVLEAFRRFAEYLADTSVAPSGSNSFRLQVGEEVTEIDRNPAWIGRALQHSGAADLLRPYRRA